MANMLTPTAMWGKFNDTLPVNPQILSSYEDEGIRFEHIAFDGRDTGEGRVRVFSCFAYDQKSPESETVMIFPDSARSVDEELLKLFVRRGYSALMVDYRGAWEGCEEFTRYPQNVSYANFRDCGRTRDFVDDSADKTCWYEWVAVGIYARKYLTERTGGEDIAVVGLRDGGEIAWKLGAARKFSCMIPVCAAGWKAYGGISKYLPDEPVMNEERYRFIAGIDSQAYAAIVKCPVLMMCSTNDERFDYDRAYDTFSRINPEYIGDSVIAYSMHGNSCIEGEGLQDMFLFLDKYLKKRHVFLPKPAEVAVTADGEDNLVARVNCDEEGVAEEFSAYLAEDCIDSSLREWTECPATGRQGEFYLNLYEKTSAVFVLASVKYSNGFTAWSKIAVRKISGRFRNMQSRCGVTYSDLQGTEGFTSADCSVRAVGGVFLLNESVLPRLVEKGDVRGLYSPCGLTTYRMNHPRYAPSDGSVLKLDIFCDENAEISVTLQNAASGEIFYHVVSVVGGVWQSIIAECEQFKNASGVSLNTFAGPFKFMIRCGVGYAVNNVMWL